MYVILVSDDNTLTATKKERIMQGSKLFDTVWFLVNPVYKGYPMAECTVVLEYVLPISRKYETEILTLSEEMYEDHLKYVLPIDTNLSSEAGKIELQLTFIYSDMDENGNSIQRVRKVSGTSINIIPISAWSNIIPDNALGALDQRIIKMDAQMKALLETAELFNDSKADNIKYDNVTSELQLTSNGKPIGDAVSIDNVVVFDEETGLDIPNDSNVVEF